ncbi:terminal uridylyltransferase 4-like [Centruroides vittatus]|uniref:terminal uridylyltransferase 4-like n=1 Tax=Centruroides vittatus TaxID=120091 RepID=UPI00350EF7AA
MIYNIKKTSFEDEERYKLLVFNLQRYIQSFIPDARLQLFGSSCNGFGFRNSDLDICFTLKNRTDEINYRGIIIAHLTCKLRRCPMVRYVVPVPAAKVPIIKFSFKYVNKEADLSLFNDLAVYNTKLLSTYCKIDSRVQKLGYVVKYFAKVCYICDASRGGLSSYAYILMLIYYLQQRDPPVIPVLQELYDHSQASPVRIVQGWNTWFYEDIDNLSNVWPDYKKNTESLAELWLGFLNFYTEIFAKKLFVVCIRRHAPLTRLEKNWYWKVENSIAIEDPFDLSHNLGGATRKMNDFIFSTFRTSYEHFRAETNVNEPNAILEHYFNKKLLTNDKSAPIKKICKKCLRLNHVTKECPLRNRENFHM